MDIYDVYIYMQLVPFINVYHDNIYVQQFSYVYHIQVGTYYSIYPTQRGVIIEETSTKRQIPY